jgi:ABC-2 type transport system ATP-binding protein
MENLKNRMHGSHVIGLTVETASDSGPVQEKLERVAGVSRVILKDTLSGAYSFEIESLQGRRVQADLARAVVEAGWNLTELRQVSLSLEEVFLQLTATEASA